MEDIIVKINDKEYSAKFSNSNPNMEINGKPYQVELMKKIAGDVFAFSVNNRMLQIGFKLNEYGNGRLTMEGLAFDIDIRNETKKLLAQFIRESGVTADGGAALIKAPMPGLVVGIMTELGSRVEKGDKIIIVEAMKMENALQSNTGGVVKKIMVKEGQAVDKDAVLIEIEADV